jgi:cyclic beta-1,2-glucan synthetase
MALQLEVPLQPFETREICFLTIAAATRDTAVDLAERHSTLDSVDWAIHDAASENARIIADLAIDPDELPTIQHLASKLIHASGFYASERMVATASQYGQSHLWGMGLSGDHPILLLRSTGEPSVILDQMLAAHRWWRRHGLQVDLVLLKSAGSGYIEPDIIAAREHGRVAWPQRRSSSHLCRSGRLRTGAPPGEYRMVDP